MRQFDALKCQEYFYMLRRKKTLAKPVEENPKKSRWWWWWEGVPTKQECCHARLCIIAKQARTQDKQSHGHITWTSSPLWKLKTLNPKPYKTSASLAIAKLQGKQNHGHIACTTSSHHCQKLKTKQKFIDIACKKPCLMKSKATSL